MYLVLLIAPSPHSKRFSTVRSPDFIPRTFYYDVVNSIDERDLLKLFYVLLIPHRLNVLTTSIGNYFFQPKEGHSNVFLDCGNCKVPISNVKLPCGHTKDNILCYLAQKPENIKCTTVVSKLVPECRHSIKEMCHVDVTKENFRCPTPCDHVLPCGHLCTGTCGRCLTQNVGDQVSIKHQSCQKICGRGHSTCNHTCKKKCHSGTDCGLCEAPCEV